ncbi:Serine/threonine-protein kinase PknH [bacterium HR29]|nr:Serine/threonine-protein kinase PknH [bacterium HR29]
MFRPARTGEHLGHYRLVERIGAGGMGTVYRAIDERTGATVAVKVIHEHLQHDPGMIERFRREAHVASLLLSPYIVRIYEFGSANGRYYIASEFVEGVKLSEILQQGALSPAEALAICSQVALALDEAAARGIVHRDIKPDNIMVTRDNAVKVMDFGIARLTYGGAVTAPGMFVGTLTYAAPEQFRGTVDPRSDLYSLGCTLFHMLAGRPPFESDDLNTMMRLHLEAPPPMEALEHVPEAVRAIVERLMAKDPNERFQTPGELLAAIESARASLGSAASGDAWTATATRTLAETRVLPLLTASGASAAGGPGATMVASGTLAAAPAGPRPWEAIPPRYRLLALFGAVAALVAGVVLALLLLSGGDGNDAVPAAMGPATGPGQGGANPGGTKGSPTEEPDEESPQPAKTPARSPTAGPTPTGTPVPGGGSRPQPGSGSAPPGRIEAGTRTLDLRVTLDTCGIAGEGTPFQVRISLQEGEGANGNGLLEDGEPVDLFDDTGHVASGYVTWPTITFLWDVQNNFGKGEAFLWLEYVDDSRLWASWTETYAEQGCVVDLEEPRPPGFVPGWERE